MLDIGTKWNLGPGFRIVSALDLLDRIRVILYLWHRLELCTIDKKQAYFLKVRVPTYPKITWLLQPQGLKDPSKTNLDCLESDEFAII